jgi:hypothetical protein
VASSFEIASIHGTIIIAAIIKNIPLRTLLTVLSANIMADSNPLGVADTCGGGRECRW